VNVTWTDLVSLALIHQFFSQDWIPRRAVWSFWEAVAESLSAATTAVSSAKKAVKKSGEVGRSAVTDGVFYAVRSDILAGQVLVRANTGTENI
jgi:hypothetical protein